MFTISKSTIKNKNKVNKLVCFQKRFLCSRDTVSLFFFLFSRSSEMKKKKRKINVESSSVWQPQNHFLNLETTTCSPSPKNSWFLFRMWKKRRQRVEVSDCWSEPLQPDGAFQNKTAAASLLSSSCCCCSSTIKLIHQNSIKEET